MKQHTHSTMNIVEEEMLSFTNLNCKITLRTNWSFRTTDGSPLSQDLNITSEMPKRLLCYNAVSCKYLSYACNCPKMHCLLCLLTSKSSLEGQTKSFNNLYYWLLRVYEVTEIRSKSWYLGLICQRNASGNLSWDDDDAVHSDSDVYLGY